MTDLEASKSMSRFLRSRWGSGARMRELDSSIGSASVVICDAAKVSLTPASGGVTVDVRSAVPLLPVFEKSQSVSPADLDVVLAKVDATVRANLPAAFLDAFDAWAASGGETSTAPRSPRTPGPSVTHHEIERHIADFWKENISHVRPSSSTDSQTLARIYEKIDISLSTESAHGELIGGILLADGYAVSVFGALLSADYPDTAGLLGVCGLIDRWARLRLDLPSPHSHVADTSREVDTDVR